MFDETDTNEVLKAADDALAKTEATLKRMSELAVLAADDKTSDDERARYQKEMNYLIGELNFIGNNTDVCGIKPLDGSIPGMFVPFGWDKGITVTE